MVMHVNPKKEKTIGLLNYRNNCLSPNFLYVYVYITNM